MYVCLNNTRIPVSNTKLHFAELQDRFRVKYFLLADDKYSTILSIKDYTSFKNVFKNPLRMPKQNKKYFRQKN